MDFVVIEAKASKGKEIKDAIDAQFCTTANPMSGTTCVLKKLGSKAYVYVPIRSGIPRVAMKLVGQGFKSSLKSYKPRIMSVKKSPFQKKEIRGDYDEEVARQLEG